ncbi:MAG: dihydrodipicolinate synthase family protein [Armatimonadetes bacterium]|nr:dihydrodipicolinate synthase family protein [Armatimonadota bacterium]
MAPFDKVIVPLVTPFTDDTATISEVRLAREIRFHIDRGAAGFLVCGEIGDFTSLSASERKTVLEWTMRDAHGLPVYVNATAQTTASAADLCQHAARHGARGAVVAGPPTGIIHASELRMHFAAVMRHGNMHVSFVGPPGFFESVSDSAGPVLERATSLAKMGAGDYCLMPDVHTDEVAFGDLVATPLAVFGADKLPQLIDGWDTFGPILISMVGEDGLSRFAHAALSESSLDVGYSRGPVQPLGPEPSKALESIVAAIQA